MDRSAFLGLFSYVLKAKRRETKAELLFSPVLVEILRAIGSPEEAMGNLVGLIYSCRFSFFLFSP